MVTPDLDTTSVEELTYCAVHPDRETALRCNKCGRYMCVDCAVRSPVGYRCRECARGIEDKFFNASEADYVIIAAVCAALAGTAGAIAQAANIPLLFMLILGLPVGGGIAEAALRAVQRRRGRQSPVIAGVATALGGLLGAGIALYLTISNAYSQIAAQLPAEARAEIPAPSLDQIFTAVASDFRLLIFLGILVFAVYGRFKMRM